MQSFSFYHAHGVLPEQGALIDQPATWVEATRIMEGCISESEQREIKEQQQEMKRQKH